MNRESDRLIGATRARVPLPSRHAVVVTRDTGLSAAARALLNRAVQSGEALRAKTVRVPGSQERLVVLYVPQRKPFSPQRLLARVGWWQASVRRKEAMANGVVSGLFGRQFPLTPSFDTCVLVDRHPRVRPSDLAAIVGMGEVLRQLAEARIDWPTFVAIAGGVDAGKALLSQLAAQVRLSDPEGSARSAILKTLSYLAQRDGRGPEPVAEALLGDPEVLVRLQAHARKLPAALAASANAQLLVHHLKGLSPPLHERYGPARLGALKAIQGLCDAQALPPSAKRAAVRQALVEWSLAALGPEHGALADALRFAAAVDPNTGACALDTVFQPLL
ncbi:MAG: hypothetical protein GXD23_06065 [Comamonadaceae bacterium]|jgi:hypothetical protein|nr:hypothetical protein [Comamonadaceae bacterium]